MLSQNKKIAVWSVLIFALSFASMVFVLEGKGTQGIEHANVLGSHEGHGSKEGPEESTAYDMYEDDSYIPRVVKELFLFRTSEYPTVLTDKNLDVMCIGEGFYRLVNSDEELGKIYSHQNLFNFVNADDVPEFAALNLKLLQEGIAVEAMGPFRLLTEDGEKLVMMSANPIKNFEGEVEYVVFQIRDLSDKVEAVTEDLREEQNKEQEAEEESKNESEYDLQNQIEEDGSTNPKVSDYLSSVFE